MTQQELLDKLKSHVSRLDGLLREPELGLMTWQMMMLQHWKAIAELWNGDEKEEIKNA